MEMTHFGSGICSQSWRMTGAIFCDTRPAMIIRSDWRGEGRKTSAPNRAISKREALIDIISMAQHARPNDIGQIEFFRAQLIALSSVVRIRPSEAADRSMYSLSMRAKSSGGPLGIGVSAMSLFSHGYRWVPETRLLESEERPSDAILDISRGPRLGRGGLENPAGLLGHLWQAPLHFARDQAGHSRITGHTSRQQGSAGAGARAAVS